MQSCILIDRAYFNVHACNIGMLCSRGWYLEDKHPSVLYDRLLLEFLPGCVNLHCIKFTQNSGRLGQ